MSKSKSKVYLSPQIQMKYTNFTQAYIKSKKVSQVSRYNKPRLIVNMPDERNETLKKILLSWGENPKVQEQLTNIN